MTDVLQRELVIAEAKSWIATPFRMNARVKGAGVDCGQLLLACYGAAGLSVPVESGNFSSQFMLHGEDNRYLELVESFAHRVDIPEPGDFAMFRRGRVYSHACIVVDWPHRVIHADPHSMRVEWTDATQYPLAKFPVIFFSFWP